MKNLLILSGCSGAGKTTFWNFLLHNADAVKRIKRAIPFFDMDTAQLVDATKSLRTKIRSHQPNAFDETDTLLVLHYDITHVYRIGTRNFADDPALSMCDRFDNIGIIHLETPADRLQAQFNKRAAQRIQRGLKKDSTMTKLRLWIRRFTAFLIKRKFLTEQEIYSNPALIDEINLHWRNFIKSDVSLANLIAILEVKPETNMQFTVEETL